MSVLRSYGPATGERPPADPARPLQIQRGRRCSTRVRTFLCVLAFSVTRSGLRSLGWCSAIPFFPFAQHKSAAPANHVRGSALCA
eukprot:353618-Chlamydomonas_euryale.AAC.1